MEPRPSDLIIAEEARRLLGVSPAKMSKMLRDGDIRFYPDPLDRRVKLISRRDAERLLGEGRRTAA